MAVKQWNSGDVLTAADLDAWAVPLYAYKTANTSRSSTTSLSPDPHLIIALAANAMYDLTGLIDYEADAAGDMKYQFTLPSGATMNYTWLGWTAADTFTNNATNTTATVAAIGGGGAGVGRGNIISGNIVTSSTAGNLGINWAQNTSSGTATIWHQYSYLKLVRVG